MEIEWPAVAADVRRKIIQIQDLLTTFMVANKNLGVSLSFEDFPPRILATFVDTTKNDAFDTVWGQCGRPAPLQRAAVEGHLSGICRDLGWTYKYEPLVGESHEAVFVLKPNYGRYAK